MIVKPSLLDHPKFLRLQRRLGKDSLHLLIRIWAHCETDCRGEVWTDKDPEYLEAVARWEGEAGFAFKAFRDAGFIDYDGSCILVHDWNEMNASLIASWTNGRTGGRPSRKTHGVTQGGVNQNQADNPQDNPSVSSKTTHGVTQGGVNQNQADNPSVTRGLLEGGDAQNEQFQEPTGNPRVSETPQNETRGTPEKRREEDTHTCARPSAFAESPSVEEVLAQGEAFRGELASGAPGPIDPAYCRSWWERKDNSRNGGWSTMVDWRRALVASWRSDFRKTFWKGGAASTSTNRERAESVPLGIRIRELEKAAEEHVGNPENTRGTLEAKAKGRAAWLALKKQIRELRGQLTCTEVEP